MKVISNTLRVVMGMWDDPGPAICGAGPAVRSREFIEEIDGELVVELTAFELSELKHCADDLIDLANAELNAVCADEVSARWTISVDGKHAVLKARPV